MPPSRADRRASIPGWSIALLTLILYAGACPVHSQVIHLVTARDYAPFAGEALPGGGMVTSLMESAYAAAGAEVDISFLPAKRGFKQARMGSFAGIFPYIDTQQRREDWFYSDPVYAAKSALFVRNDSDLEIATLQDLADRGLTICTPIGSSNSLLIEEYVADGRLQRQRTPSQSACFRMLVANRVDVVSQSRLSGLWSMVKSGVDPALISTIEVPGNDILLHLLVSRQREDAAEHLALFNRGLAEIRANGTYQRIVASYPHPGTASPAP